MFKYNMTDEFKVTLRKLAKKYNKRAQIVKNKIKEIIENDSNTINRYYNCSYELKKYKHSHIDKSFIMIFEVDIDENFIIFHSIGHHDKFFKK